MSGDGLGADWLVRLAAATPSPDEPFDASKVEPGLLGLAFFLAMAGAVVLLVLSMRKHLGRIDVDRHAREHPGAVSLDKPNAPGSPGSLPSRNGAPPG